MQTLRYLLAPIAFLYGIIILLRNLLYDWGVLPSYKIPVKSICVGNLSVGGTGKSPMTIFLLQHFKAELKTVVLSRGYGRQTKGFLEATPESTHLEIGDEPLMYAKRFLPEVKVYVSESRKEGVEQLLKKEAAELIVLDDAFQHRKVKAGFSIVLSDFNKPFYSDYMLPVGNLRENRTGINRSDLLVFSKCPENLSKEAKNEAVKKSKLPKGNIFFSTVKYGKLTPFGLPAPQELKRILLVTGIANPSPLITHLQQQFEVESIIFPDHHNFTVQDIHKIYKKFDTFATDNKAIITTEKDYVRLLMPEFADLLTRNPWFYQQMTVEIDRPNEFLEIIESYVRKV